jgi:RNA polymerase sigma-70 factor, ECF subfamily
MSDEELMVRFQDGDDGAFEPLYERYKRPIYQFVFRRIGHGGRAEEVTQEVFLGIIRTRGSWRQESTFKTYIYKIALNQCTSEARRADFKKLDPLEHPDGTQLDVRESKPGPESVTTSREEAEIVKQALGKLEDEQREALLLREYQGLSYEEIAEVTGVALGTVKSRIFRGKLELKRLLEPLLKATPGEPGGAKIIPIRSSTR